MDSRGLLLVAHKSGGQFDCSRINADYTSLPIASLSNHNFRLNIGQNSAQPSVSSSILSVIRFLSRAAGMRIYAVRFSPRYRPADSSTTILRSVSPDKTCPDFVVHERIRLNGRMVKQVTHYGFHRLIMFQSKIISFTKSFDIAVYQLFVPLHFLASEN